MIGDGMVCRIDMKGGTVIGNGMACRIDMKDGHSDWGLYGMLH